MTGYFFGFGLARPIFFAALLALIPIFLWQRRRLTHFPAFIQTVLLALRCAVAVLLVFALIGPQRVEENFRKFVVFCVDQSGSLPNAGYSSSSDFLTEALKNQDENEYAVLPFAGQPGAIGSAVLKPGEGENSPLVPLKPEQTDFAKATVLAEAAAPEDYVGEVVLLSDFQTANVNANELGTINKFGVEAYSVDIGSSEQLPEICVDRVVVPASVSAGQPIPVEVRVKSNVAQTVNVFLTSNPAQPFAPVRLTFRQAGIQTAYFEASPAPEGTLQFVATIAGATSETSSGADSGASLGAGPGAGSGLAADAAELPISLEKDTFLENNRFAAATTVLPQGKILLVENRKNLAAPLAKALNEQYLTLVSVAANQIPSKLDDYEAVILSNIPATAFDEAAFANLERFVQTGGGLIAAGGDQSFTAGGWHGTILEKLMPVECVVQPNQPRPALAMVLVIDRSQSMIENSDEPSKTAMELSKQAARRAVEVLTEQDQLGVLTFEDNFSWDVELASCTNKQTILEQIDKIEASGRTNLYPALEKAYLALSESFAQRKHIIVLTDGISQPGDFESISKQIAAAGITLSTVAVGEEGDCPVLSDLARNCNGKRYLCKDPKQLPTIFAMETAAAAKMGIIEKTTKLQTVGSLSAIKRVDAARSPSLLGYVQTQIKPDAFALYNAPSITDSEGASIADPILAWRRYGAQGGIVVAFTSDVESRWSRAWQRWDGFGPFWSRLVNHAKRPSRTDNYSVTYVNGELSVTGPVAEFSNTGQKSIVCRLTAITNQTLIANPAAGQAAGQAEVESVAQAEPKTASGADPAALKEPILLQETAPGTFLASDVAPGAYRVQIERENELLWQTSLVISDNYTDEYRLDKSSRIESGKIPPAIAASDVFNRSEKAVLKTYRYWSWLLALALCLTAAEVFIRRTGVA